MGRARSGVAAPGTAPPDPDSIEAQPPGDPETVARSICLRQLEHRARSRGELAQTLRKRGVPDDAAVRVLDRFEEVGLIDDTALAGMMAGAQHRERGLARRAIAAKLGQRGFEAEAVGAALAGIDADDERARGLELVVKRQRALAALPPEVQTRRLVGLLARKGYAPGMSYDIVREVLSGAADAADDVFGEPT
ncbi:MAG TPA: regulatory protein RecX [Jatrophihabitans sp.]|jgi:regulatory protein|uniref:regulatory protein RecX n=1 Tax=Jatrophihabitans sp. TaxID=1932789 RepID=UPI002E022884|nr:regulatory protein RecX [Jatrophihabitans sp.]